MAWQQDLHQLEQDLAAGRLSAQDYRRRRDELLAAANSGQNQPADGSGPFPPAFRWGDQPSAEEKAATERTESILPMGQRAASTGQAGDPGEATQVVSGVVRQQDAERTQVVRNSAAIGFSPQQRGGRQPATAQQGSGADKSPNWAVNDAFGGSPRQGPEAFTSSGVGGVGGRRIALIALIVVVVAGLVVGRWLIFGQGGSSQAGHGSPSATTSAPPTSPAPRAEIGPLVYAPGIPTAESFTSAQLVEVKQLPQPDLDILANTTLTKADSVLSVDGSNDIDLWAFTMRDSAAAQDLAKAFDTDQLRFGFAPTNIKTSDGRYLAYTSQQQAASGSTNVVYRLHYVVGNQVIRVEVFGPDGGKARAEFLKVLGLQTKLTPPSK